MSLDIFDHPVVVRLLEGEPVLASEMRQAIVDFWKANGTFPICANCTRTHYVRGEAVEKPQPKGCCGGCADHVDGRGCGKRNLACLFFACKKVEELLKEAGTWENFDYLHCLMATLTYRKEPFFNSCRLPPRARLYLDDEGDDRADWVGIEGLSIESDYEGVPRDRLEGGV